MKSKIFLSVWLMAEAILPSFALSFPDMFNKVDQTYGDFDGSIYHDGIDLPGGPSQIVKSPISSGTVVGSNHTSLDQGYVCVKDWGTSKVWVFGHIQPDVQLLDKENHPVDSTTVLGVLQRFPGVYPGESAKPEYNHLHVALSIHPDKKCVFTGAEDPLGYFSPISSQTLALGAADIVPVPDKFTANTEADLETGFPVTGETKTIYNDVDLIVHGRDNVNGGNRSGVYRIDYSIVDNLVGNIISSGTPFIMREDMAPRNNTLTKSYLSPPTSDPEDGSETDWQNYYNVTNSGTQDPAQVTVYSNIQENSWKTKKYPDSEYIVIAKTYAYPPATDTKEAWRLVMVDNYRPYVKQVVIADAADLENPVYSRAWELDGSVLKPQADYPDGPLIPGQTYQVTATMSEYTQHAAMRTQDGTTIPLVSEVNSTDTHNSEYTGEITIPTEFTEDKVVPLVIQDMDIAENPSNALLKIDAGRTSSIDPAKELTRDATGTMLGTAGNDTFHYFRIDAASPIIRYNRQPKNYQALDESCAGNSAELCGTESQPINITYSSVPFSYTDIGSGLKELAIYKETLCGDKFYTNPYFSFIKRAFDYQGTMTIPDGKYVQTITDNLGHTTTMYFRIDPVTPRLEISSITMSEPFSTYNVYGVVIDTGSGLDFLRLSRLGESIPDYALVRGTTESVHYSFNNLNMGDAGAYVMSTQDLAGNLMPWAYVQFADSSNSPNPSDPESGMANAVAHHITEVRASGSPCTVTVTSTWTTLGIPVETTIQDETPIITHLTYASATPVSLVSLDRYLHGSIIISVSPSSACVVQLKGTTVSALLLDDPVKIFRYGQEPTHFDLTYTPDGMDVTFRRVVWDTETQSSMSSMLRSASSSGDAGTGPRMNVTPVTPPAPAAGYVNYPPEAPRAWQVETANVSYEGIDVKAYGLSDKLSDADKARVRILRHKDGGITDVTTGLDVTSTSVLGTTSEDCTSACTFTLVAPLDIFDKVGPLTDLSTDGTFELAGKLYVSSTVPLSISAVDISTDIYTISGVATTYYLLDIEPSSACLHTDYNPAASSGTCANSVYGGPFTLPEGEHSVFYISADKVGNYSEAKTAAITVDGTAPASELKVNGEPVASGSTVSATDADFITLTATDTVSNGVASGLTTTYFLIDIAPEECDYSDWTGGVDGVGSCENPYYSGPLTLPEGEHTLYYTSEDNTGNSEAVKSVSITVAHANSALDITPPVVTLSINGQALAAGTTASITSTDTVSLAAVDEGSGVAGIGYTIDAEFSTTTAAAYTGPFTLALGPHTVYYSAADNVGNMAEVKSAFLTVSATAQTLLPIVPSSGPIGMPFTITGSEFGTYSAGTTIVTIGGVSAPLTLWSTTTIKGTIPGALSSGEQAVVVMRGTSTIASVAPFTVTAPALYTLTPSSGAIGLPFTITGESFGNYVANSTKVLMGGATMPLTLWTDTKIQGAIPGNLAVGDYDLVVERALNGGVARTSSATFTLANMQAYWLAPSSGPIGMPFTITGEGFGNYTAAYTHVLLGDTTAPLTLWTDAKIQGTVPGSLASGQYPVVVERRTADGGLMQTSSTMTFEVVTVDVASMTPVAGPIGMPFTIYGSNFGNYVANQTKVLIGGTTAPLTLWTATQIKGTVPGALAAGEYPVVVERALNGGQILSSALTWTLTLPVMDSIAPSSGPIGMPFVINGANFGNYVANYTKVLIGGATAPLTLWSTDTIKGTIPGSLAAGDYDLVVVRALNGGEVRTSTAAFAVVTPVLNTVSPATATVIAPFTLSGASFGNYVANYTKVLINGATAPLTLWTDTQIQGKLPFLLNGTYPVQVQRSLNGGLAETATAYITVAEPVISSMTPTTGAVGTVFNLYGNYFGPYDASQTRVTIGGVACTLSLWNDTNIRGTVPAGLTVGTYTVVAMRGQGLSNELEYTIPEAFRVSMVRPVTAFNAEFKLGEVYVYPNPAKGGKVPVFHVEVGLADSVKIKVFTVSGQMVHDVTLTGIPQAIGSTYAYESAWEGHIASGVYFYTMEAEKSGKKLKAKGRFAVVR